MGPKLKLPSRPIMPLNLATPTKTIKTGVVIFIVSLRCKKQLDLPVLVNISNYELRKQWLVLLIRPPDLETPPIFFFQPQVLESRIKIPEPFSFSVQNGKRRAIDCEICRLAGG